MLLRQIKMYGSKELHDRNCSPRTKISLDYIGCVRGADDLQEINIDSTDLVLGFIIISAPRYPGDFADQIEKAARPYAFIKFDTFIQRTKKFYQDTRTQRNVSKLNDELYEVHQIMPRNVQEVLGVGEKLDCKFFSL
ncbi:hypothetical protein Tco_1181123 [Tanacetum coccineum]